MLLSIKNLIPRFIKEIIQNSYSRYKYSVYIGRGGHVHNVELESNCSIGEYSSFTASKMGLASYIGNNSDIRFTEIGRFCAIGDSVRICLGNHPSHTFVSMHPCFYSLEGNSIPSFARKQIFEEHKYVDNEDKYVCKIGNDVWIGNNVSILDGIIIGDGAIIGTGAVVTKNVEPYSIVGGIPSKIIKYRFSAEQIKFLLNFKWWDRDEKWLIEHSNLFANIDKMIEFFE